MSYEVSAPPLQGRPETHQLATTFFLASSGDSYQKSIRQYHHPREIHDFPWNEKPYAFAYSIQRADVTVAYHCLPPTMDLYRDHS